jgi:hypothetical protein
VEIVPGLLACPFCRELFDASEADRCPECDIPLAPLERLPPSLEVIEEQAADWERDPPEDRRLPLLALGRGRGLLLGIALASLLCFWLAPWVDITSPTTATRTGHSLARGPIGWLWGGAVAWGVTLALVISRRSQRQMWGIRPILTLFAAMTASEIVLLLWLSPEGNAHLRYHYQWTWGLYASLALSLAGIVVALRFGGKQPEQPPRTPLRGSLRDARQLLH